MMVPGYPASMRKGIAAALLISTTVVGFAVAEDFVERPAPTGPSFLGYVPDELVVVFKPSTAHELYSLPAQAARARANLARVQQLLDRVAARSFDREFPDARPKAPGSMAPEMTGHYILKLAPGMDLDEAKAELEKSADVDHVEKNGIHAIDLRPNDPRYIWTPLPQPTGWPNRQWNYINAKGMGCESVWDTETGDPAVAAAVADIGTKYRHTDLGGANPPGPADNDTQGNIWVNPLDAPDGIDNDGNGFIDDVIGWDFVAAAIPGGTCTGYDTDCGLAENDPNDTDGHGTHVAGTIGAITNNARGVAGIAGGFSDGTTTGAGNGVKVIPMRIGHRARVNLPPPTTVGIVSMTYAAQAMNYIAGLVDRGINVAAFNCSWGNSNTGGLEAAALNLQAKDVLIVCSAGNSNALVASFLPTLAGVVTVGATDSLGNDASFTSFGPSVDLSAPGVAIISTGHDPAQVDTTLMYVGVSDGTSMSTPHVVGAAAILESYNPALTAQQKADLLINHTKAFGPLHSKQIGTGILDLAAALAAAPSPTTGVGDRPIAGGPRIQLRAFPNPARGSSDLAIQARPGQRVDLRIVDASGRSVRTMSGTADGTGVLRLRWDGRDSTGRTAGSGLFFVTASTASGRASSKLVVLD